MSRPLRIEYPGAFYHVMNRGTDRQLIFVQKNEDRFLFKEALRDSVRMWKIKIHAFSLMDNHYHLLIETPLGNLSRALRHIDGVYTQRFNRAHHRDGPLFRGRFKAILVQQETYFLELVRYIHLNGVRALQYPNPLLDPHGSHKAYLVPSECPDWLSTHLVLSSLAPQNSPHARDELDRFVRAGISKEVKEILDRKRWPAVIGHDDFIKNIRATYLSPKPHPEKPQERALIRRPLRPEEIIKIVSEIYACGEKSISEVTPGKPNPARQVAMYFLRNSGLLSYSQIGKLMGGISDSAVEQNCLRTKMKTADFIRIKNLLAVGT